MDIERTARQIYMPGGKKFFYTPSEIRNTPPLQKVYYRPELVHTHIEAHRGHGHST